MGQQRCRLPTVVGRQNNVAVSTQYISAVHGLAGLYLYALMFCAKKNVTVTCAKETREKKLSDSNLHPSSLDPTKPSTLTIPLATLYCNQEGNLLDIKREIYLISRGKST